jgi:putative aldouronate transport system substrate-binding protein
MQGKKTKRESWKMKKGILILFVFIMVFSIFTGCSSDNTPKNTAEQQNEVKDGTGNKEPVAEAKPSYWMEQPTEVTMFMYPSPTNPYNKEWPIWDWIEEETNIRIKGINPAGEYNDAINLTMASGDIPDIVYVATNNDANKFGAQGAFLDLTENLDKLPNYKEFLEENEIARAIATTPDGSVYGTITKGLNYTSGRTWMYRKDIFDKHGLKVPETWEELENVLTTLKKEYPKSSPLVWRRHVKNIGYLFSLGFNTWYDYYLDEDGNFGYGPTEDGYKVMLETLNRFYEKGLIPPDWLSLSTNQWKEMMTTGQAFVTPEYLGRVAQLNSALQPGEEIAWMAPPKGPQGEGYVPDNSVAYNGFAVYSKAKQPEAALKYVDFLYSERGKELLSWGKEGVTYDMVDGKKVLKEKYKLLTELQIDTGLMTAAAYGEVDPESSLSLYSDEQKELFNFVKQYEYPQPNIWPAWSEEEEEVIISTWVNNEKLREEYMAKFINGETEFTEWDSYVQQTKNYTDKMDEMFKNAYKRVGLLD